jgi:hypothetical protein
VEWRSGRGDGRSVAVSTQLERQARNEALVREVNERIDTLDRDAERIGSTPPNSNFGFHCECGRGTGGCLETVWMTLAEYDRVREQDDRFVLAPGHETSPLERVVEQTDRYVIVDKVAEVERFVEDDPRERGER